MPAFLQAHGTIVTQQGARSGVPQHLRQLTAELITDVTSLAKPLATLNWFAQKAADTLVSPSLTESQRHWQLLQALINHFAEAELLHYLDHRLQFIDEAARFFVNGSWLEDHTFSLLFGLRQELPKIQDIDRGIEIIRQHTGKAVKNELDVAFLHNNHLYLIECKTKRFEINPEHSKIHTDGVEVIYKLDTLKGLLSDVHTQVMLLSYQPLSAWDQQRAYDLGVECCTAQQLLHLKAHLKRWIVG